MKTREKYSEIVKNTEMGIMIQALLFNVLPVVLLVWIESETLFLIDTTISLASYTEISSINIIWIIFILIVVFIILTKFAVFLFASVALVIWILLEPVDECDQCSGVFQSMNVVSRFNMQNQTYELSCPHCGYYLARTRTVNDILHNPLQK